MPKQTILLTVFPRAVSVVTNKLPVSVYVSPRLTGARTLDAFPDWLNWTQLLKDNGFQITVDVNGHAIDAAIDTTPLRPDLWVALFASETLVDNYEFSDYSDRTVISYAVRDAMLAVKAVYQQAAKELGLPADPRDKESGPRRAGKLTSLLDGFQLEEWSDLHRSRMRSVFGQRLDHRRPARRARPAAMAGADGLPSAAHLNDNTEDIRLLKAQVGSEFALYSRMPPGAPIVKPDMATVFDFHKVISALNAYPSLLRALGLVFDLDLSSIGVPLTTGVPFGRLSMSRAEPGWQEFAIETDLRPVAETAIQYHKAEDGQTYWFTAPSPQSDRGHVLGLLKLDPDAFCLAQFDVDGAMHKLMMLAAGVPTSGSKLSPALHPTKFDEANTVPGLRSVGISLIQDERARALLASIATSKRFNDRLNGNLVDEAPLFAEDLVRGYRLDVWNSFNNTWRSLHLRKGRYAFGDVVFTTDEEGFTQLAVMQPAPDPAHAAPNNDLYLHEAVARWGGWSLSVPPPGKAISRSGDPKKAVPPDDPNDQDPDDRQNEPVTPFQMKATFNVTPRSLPSLRFGRRYRLRVRVVDLAGNSLAFDDQLAAEGSRQFAIPRDEDGFAYLRYEPVPAPQIVRRDDLAITGPGSALDRLVIRTFNSDISLDAQAPDLSGSDRHIVPPRASIEMAERHGMLDDLSGRLKGDAATYSLLVARDDENGSQFPSAAVPGQTVPLPIVTADEITQLPYVPDPLSRYAALRDLPGAPEHALGKVTGGVLKYDQLKDPNPRAGSVTQVNFDNAPDWLKTRSFRLALDEGNQPPAWDSAQRLLTVFLPKGSTTIVPLSSVPTSDDLKLLGIWQWLREYISDLSGAETIRFGKDSEQEEIATLLQYVIEGGHWMLTPPTLLTLVSAVQQPLGHPRFEALAVQRANPNTKLQPLSIHNRLRFVGGAQYDPTSEQMETITAWRVAGALDTYLIGSLRVHGQTTAKVDLFAEWEEWIDDPNRLENPPVREARSGFVDTLPLHDPSEDRVLLAAGGEREVGIYDATQDLIGFTTRGDVFGRDPALLPEGDAAPRHYLGDTRHRRITYTATATTRYRDYFPQDQDLDFTRTSAPVEVNVPASARPPLASVRYAVPTFGWERQSSTNLVRSVRYGGGVRVYLERPWFESGEGELLGVVLSQAVNMNKDAREAWKLFITQWGRDPIWRTQPVWPPMPGPEHFPLAVAAESNLRLGESVPAGEDGKLGLVSVAGHVVTFDPQRKLWYCDIVLNSPSYNPFVRLALARYQPNAIAEAKLSRVVLTDFVQLTPDRSALVSADPYHPKELRLSVTGTAPDGPPSEAPGELPGLPTKVRVRVQNRASVEHGEFGWQDVSAGVARVEVNKIDSDEPGLLLWQGKVIFTNAPESGAYRLLIEEREYISADHFATSVVNGTQADQQTPMAPGRLIYAEIVMLGDTLTVVPELSASGTAQAELTAPLFIGDETLNQTLNGLATVGDRPQDQASAGAVLKLQTALIQVGYPIVADGTWTDETYHAILSFRTALGLLTPEGELNGYVDAETMRAFDDLFGYSRFNATANAFSLGPRAGDQIDLGNGAVLVNYDNGVVVGKDWYMYLPVPAPLSTQWLAAGGPAVIGLPISEPISLANGTPAQTFELSALVGTNDGSAVVVPVEVLRELETGAAGDPFAPPVQIASAGNSLALVGDQGAVLWVPDGPPLTVPKLIFDFLLAAEGTGIDLGAPVALAHAVDDGTVFPFASGNLKLADDGSIVPVAAVPDDLARFKLSADSSRHFQGAVEGSSVRFLVGGDVFFAAVQSDLARVGPNGFVYLASWNCEIDLPCFPGGRTLRNELTRITGLGGEVCLLLWAADPISQQLGAATFLPVPAIASNLLQNWMIKPHNNNPPAVAAINALPNSFAILDGNTASFGSHHQKIIVIGTGDELIAYVGGIEFTDDRIQAVSDGAPLFDCSVRIIGPGAKLILDTFADRWNAHPMGPVNHPLKHANPPAPPASVGPISVQVGHTYSAGFPFKNAIRTASELVANAIQNATEYFYLEDQYFVGDPRLGAAIRTALARGAMGIIVIAAEDSVSDLRDVGNRRRSFISPITASFGQFLVFEAVGSDGTSTGINAYVHSKLCLVDDKILVIGSMNSSKRSWSHDSEVMAALVDMNGPDGIGPGSPGLARAVRMDLWSRHLKPANLVSLPVPIEPLSAAKIAWLAASAAPNAGLSVRRYPPGPAPSHNIFITDFVWNTFFDPA